MSCDITNFSAICLGIAIIFQSIALSRNLREIRAKEELFSRQIRELQILHEMKRGRN